MFSIVLVRKSVSTPGFQHLTQLISQSAFELLTSHDGGAARKLQTREIGELVKTLFEREILIVVSIGSANGLDIGLEAPETHGLLVDIIVHFPEAGLVLVSHRFVVWWTGLVPCRHQHGRCAATLFNSFTQRPVTLHQLLRVLLCLQLKVFSRDLRHGQVVTQHHDALGIAL